MWWREVVRLECGDEVEGEDVVLGKLWGVRLKRCNFDEGFFFVRGVSLVGVFVRGFVVWFFLWIGKLCWSAGGGAEVRHWCKPGVVRGVRLEVVNV